MNDKNNKNDFDFDKEINLLPDDLRSLEKKEISTKKKEEKVVRSTLSNPELVKEEKGQRLHLPKEKKLSFWDKLKKIFVLPKSEFEKGRYYIEDKTIKKLEIPPKVETPPKRVFVSPPPPPAEKKIEPNVIIPPPPAPPRPPTPEEPKKEIVIPPIETKEAAKPLVFDIKNNGRPVSAPVPPPMAAPVKSEVKAETKTYFKPQEDGKKQEEGKKKIGLSINLIPVEERIKTLFLDKTLRVMGLAAILSLLIVVAFYLIIWVWGNDQKSKVAEVNKKVEETQQKISGFDNVISQAYILQSKSEILRDLLANHLHWTKFFSFLEGVSLPNVYYLSISANKDGTINLAAQTETYSSMASQIVAFQNDKESVEKIEVNAANQQISKDKEGNEISRVLFNIMLKVKPSLFLTE